MTGCSRLRTAVATGSDLLELFQAEFVERKVGGGALCRGGTRGGGGVGAMEFAFSKGRGESPEIQKIPAWCSLDLALCLLEKTFS